MAERKAVVFNSMAGIWQQIPKLGEVIQTFSYTPRAFRLVWETSPGATLGLAFLTLGGALLPAAQGWVGKLIVDSVVLAIQSPAEPEKTRAVFFLLILELALFLSSTLISQARGLLQQILQLGLGNKINGEVIRKALTLDLAYFENPEFYDRLQNARRQGDQRPVDLIDDSFMIVQNMITLASFAVLLYRFSPWVVVILLVTTIPAFVAEARYSQEAFRLLTWRAPETRRLNYLSRLLTEDSSVKEVKLFNLGESLLQRYLNLFDKFFREDRSLAVRRTLAGFALGLIATAGFYGSYAWIVWETVQSKITLGDMTLYLTIFRQGQTTFQRILSAVSGIYENNLFMANLFDFLALKPEMTTASHPAALSVPLRRGIEFRGVSFRYPGSERWALREIDLHIRPEEKIALVGANGAGKTTLVKLLTRLYDPTEGRILIDGADIREIDPVSLRQRIGVIFQDFVRYQLLARENVGVGQIEALEDLDRIMEAARKSGAHPVIEKLPEGYQTMLGRWFNKGLELSLGEWQKIALGRAFMRDAEVLILDEPTSSLDAQTEYEIFQRFKELTAGKIALLISHRFSTVRMADRIAVIHDGRLAEIGSHDELVRHGGIYAQLFALQAEGYR
jgi:ATP-binding cassette subfamily B protein